MSEKRYVINVSIILAISVMLLLFIFVIVHHHRSIPDRVQQARSALLDAGLSAAAQIKPGGQDNTDSAETQQKPK